MGGWVDLTKVSSAPSERARPAWEEVVEEEEAPPPPPLPSPSEEEELGGWLRREGGVTRPMEEEGPETRRGAPGWVGGWV